MGLTKILTYETKNYSMFKKIQGNRTVSDRNVKNIVKNIRENGLKPTIVIVNEKMEVIDGQHRIEALRKLNLPVYYQIHDGLTLADCIAMNTSVKTWSCNDYVYSYAENGNVEYQEIIRLNKIFPEFTFTNILAVLNLKTTTRVGRMIRAGDFTLDCKGTEAEDRLFQVAALLEPLGNNIGRRECVVISLARIMCLECVDYKRFKEQLDKYGSMLTDIIDIKCCVNRLEEIYNYRRANRVRFVSKYYEKYEDCTNK